MDTEIPLLTQAHELRADQHFDKKIKTRDGHAQLRVTVPNQSNLLNSQLSEVVCLVNVLTNLSRTEKHLQGWVMILGYGADQCYNNGEFCYKNQSDTQNSNPLQ